MRDQLEKRLKKVKELATLPLVANNVIQLTQSPKSSALEVGEAISQDAALASKVLRIANSAFYGFPREITTIHLSIVVLGFANIRNIVLTASISDMMSGKVKNRYFDREAFWKHSIACAITSKLLAKRLGFKNDEEVFLWGLLHDLGKIILDSHFRKEFTEVVHLVKKENILIRDAEKRVLGFDHAEVGGIVCERWNLPPALIKCIKLHHTPTLANESIRMVSIVHVADILCRALGLGNGGDGKIPCVDEEAWKLLLIDKKMIKGLFNQMEEEVDNATAFFSFMK